jgi:hypothetical protein
MKAKLVQFKNLKFEIPDDEFKPILVKWMDEKGNLMDVFEVESGDDEKELEEFMKELLMQEETNWSCQRSGRLDKNISMNINIPKNFWDDMGKPTKFSVAYDYTNKIVKFKGLKR